LKDANVSEQLLACQKAFVLLQFFRSEDRSLKRSQLKEKLRTKNATRSLGFDDDTALKVLSSLVQDRFLAERKSGKGASYRLTDGHPDLLKCLEQQYPTIELRMKGETLNTLLAAVRQSGSCAVSLRPDDAACCEQQAMPAALQRDQPEAVETVQFPDDFTDAILAEFEELRREKYSHTGLVPIFEVRQRIAERFGPAAARHDVLDPQFQRLRQDERLRLVPISFLGDATPEQLNASIPGVNETLFYLEPADEQYVAR
jgi:hypothetical protein